MEPLFDSEFITASIKSQADLDAAFLKYPKLAKAYIQTALYWSDLRKWYECNWPKIFRFLDKDFINRFKMEQEHIARAWEFNIATVLVNKGLELMEKTWTYGPDFCIKTSTGQKIWIEAITCNLADDGSVPKYDLMSGVAITIDIENDHPLRALRITGAINEKFGKFKEYLKDPKSNISEKDCLIIAVNGEVVQSYANSMKLLNWAVFGQGPDIYVKIDGQEKLDGPFYKPIPNLIKKIKGSDVNISANFLEMDESQIISAVLYCGHNVLHDWLNDSDPGDNFLFAYHTNPKNPIPEKTFNFGIGIYKDSESQQIKEFKQK